MKKVILNIVALTCILFFIQCNAAVNLQYEIKGINAPLLTNVQARLKSEMPTSSALTEIQAQEWYQQSINEIRNALEPYGYFKPEIKTTLQQHTQNWLISYQINPGPVLTITQLKININGAGKNDFLLNKFIDEFPLQVGQPLETSTYEQAKQQFFNIALAQGYLDAQLITHTIKINRQHYTSIISLELKTGPRYYFGSVVFNQNDLDETLLRGYLRFETGNPYSSKKLLSSQDALNNSGYFQAIQTNAIPNLNTQQVPIEFNFVSRPAHQYSAGVGYGTDTGARALLGWEWRRITRSGHRMATFIQASQIQNSLQAVYRIPGANPRISEYQISASATKDNLPLVNSFTKQIGIAYVVNKKHWQQTTFLNYALENFKFDNEPDSRFTRTLTPGINFTATRADSNIYAHNGYRIGIRLQGSLHPIMADTTFLQIEAQGKYIHSFGEDNENRIVTRADIGYTAVSDLSNFPATMRFYAGGTQSMRGYNFNALGPGRNIVVGSVEYQRRIIGNWNAAIFYDAGNAFDNFPLILKRGVGVGIVWASPLGPIALTVSRALDEPGALGKPVIQFNMGPDFS